LFDDSVVHTSIVCCLSSMLMRPFFSVIVCTFNRSALLPRALDSVLSQVESDWEVVIVDDASTDDSVQTIQKYTESDPRFRLIRHDRNRGTSAARNTGIEAATGLFVTFLDSDDAYDPEHLSSRKIMLLQHPGIHLLHGGVTVIGDPFVVDKDDPTKTIHVDDCVVGGTFVIRKDVFDLIGGFADLAYADDAEFHDRAERTGLMIARTDHPTYIYHRDTPGQATSNHGT